MPPKGGSGTSRNSATPAGVLPVNPANIQAHAAKQTARLKLEIRRLPPSLTQEEFQDAFGDEWKKGGGKVDWMEYRMGKIKSPGKYPEQSRAYVHLTTEAHIKSFEAKFLSITFHDAKGSHRDQALKHLPPMLGFAPSQRIPGSKQRVDGRQGTIDQDPEFIAFLEGETQPVTKPAALDSGHGERPTKEKITTTPLIEALREKKAAKAKAAATKPTKHSKDEKKEGKDDKTGEKGASAKAGKGSEPTPKGGPRAEQISKDAPKGKNQSKSATSSTSSSTPAPASPNPKAKRERERVTPNTIKNMLQRDLGLAAAPRRGAKIIVPNGDTAKSTDHQPPTSSAKSAPGTTSSTPAKPSGRAARNAALADKGNGQSLPQDTAKAAPAAPMGILKKNSAAPSTQRGQKGKPDFTSTDQPTANGTAAQPTATTPVPVKTTKPVPQPGPGATKAYLKHANASQGITEPLLKTALSIFGEVASVEIDKRKGTALAEWKTHEALKAAMAKRSVPVAQGAVEVLEYREKPAPAAGRGGGSIGRGGSSRGRGRAGQGRGGSSAVASPAPSASAATSKADGT